MKESNLSNGYNIVKPLYFVKKYVGWTFYKDYIFYLSVGGFLWKEGCDVIGYLCYNRYKCLTNAIN